MAATEEEIIITNDATEGATSRASLSSSEVILTDPIRTQPPVTKATAEALPQSTVTEESLPQTTASDTTTDMETDSIEQADTQVSISGNLPSSGASTEDMEIPNSVTPRNSRDPKHLTEANHDPELEERLPTTETSGLATELLNKNSCEQSPTTIDQQSSSVETSTILAEALTKSPKKTWTLPSNVVLPNPSEVAKDFSTKTSHHALVGSMPSAVASGGEHILIEVLDELGQPTITSAYVAPQHQSVGDAQVVVLGSGDNPEESSANVANQQVKSFT